MLTSSNFVHMRSVQEETEIAREMDKGALLRRPYSILSTEPH